MAEPGLNLLVVTPSGRSRGGAEEALLQLVRERRAANLQISVAFLEEGDLPPLVQAEGVETIVFDSGRFRDVGRLLRTVAAIRRFILAQKPDVVLGWMTKGHLYGAVAAALTGTPAVYFQMGLPDGGGVDRLARYLPTIGALGCSDYVAREQQKRVKHRVLGVPMAFDGARIAEAAALSVAEAKEKLGFDPDRPLVGMVGRLQRWKGMHVFAAAMAEVLEKHPACQAVIVGGPHHHEPDYPACLEGVLASSGLRDRVRLAGARRDAVQWMQAMDIFVHASDHEPFGIVILEAMALGKAVIATREGGPSEIIAPDINGQLTPWNDAPALARAILRYLDEPAFAQRCSHAAQERAQDFTAPQYVRRLRSALEDLLGRRTA